MTVTYELSIADHLAWYDHCLLLPSGQSARSPSCILARLRRWRFARQVRSFRRKGAHGPRTLELSEKVVREFSKSFDFSTSWQDVSLVSVSSTHLFIAHSSMNAHIVPLRSFGSVAARDEFVAFARNHASVA